MKKVISLVMMGVILTTIHAQPIKASNDNIIGSPKLAVIVKGRKVQFQGGDPVMENNRMQVPLRGIGEALGAKIGYSDNKVTYEKNGKSISLTLGSSTAVVDGKSVKMDTVAKAVKGRTYVPLRFVSENLGEKVEWDKVGQWVWIGSKDIPSTDDQQYKLRKLSEFSKYYKKDAYLLKNISGEPYEGIKVFEMSQLPIQLSNDLIIYDMYLVKKNNEDYIAIRSTANGSPIYHMVENSFVKYRRDVHNGGIIHEDRTITNFYPVKSRSDLMISGVRSGVDWTKYDLKTADYIAVRTVIPEKYIVAISSPFK